MGCPRTGSKREKEREVRRIKKAQKYTTVIDALKINSTDTLETKAHTLGISRRTLYDLRMKPDLTIAKGKKCYSRRKDCLLTVGQEEELVGVVRAERSGSCIQTISSSLITASSILGEWNTENYAIHLGFVNKRGFGHDAKEEPASIQAKGRNAV